MVVLSDIQAAAARVSGRIHRTPVFSAATLAPQAGCHVALKAELFQKAGSFKIRGVLNRLLTLPRADLERGLISLSAGNHAAALAYGARDVGTSAAIVMPSRASRAKIEATKSYGGEVVLTERPLMDVCHELQEARDLTLVHPFDDPVVIAGQGTTGLEIVEDVPHAAVVIVPVGGGGLISGVAAAVKHRAPDTRVVGVEPEGSDVMTQSLKQGSPVTLERSDTIADGLAAPFAGRHTLAHVQEYVDEVVCVPDTAIVDALRLLYERAKLAVEPSGAAGLAALLTGAVQVDSDSTAVCLVSGGNVEAAALRGWL